MISIRIPAICLYKTVHWSLIMLMWTVNFQMFKLVLERAEEPEIKLPTSAESLKKQESSRKTSISALLTMPKPELPVVQAGFRKGRGTRDQIANIHWIMEKAREFQTNIYFCFVDYAKAFDCVDHNQLENSERGGNTRPPDLPLEKSVCRLGSNS